MLPLVLSLALSAPPEPLAFTVVGTGEGTLTGKLRTVSLTLGVEVATTNGPQTVPGLVALRKPDTALPPFPTGAHIITAVGDRVPGTVTGGDAKALFFAHATSDEKWSVALDAVAAVWLKPPAADTPPDPTKYTWLAGTPTRDALLYRNGDTVRGTLTGFTATGVKFIPDGGTARDVPLTDLAAIGFNPRFVRPRKPKGPYANLVLADGTRLNVSEIALKGNALVCKAVCGPAVEVPLTKLVALNVLQGSAVYLSDLKPKKTETTGFLGDGWAWAADRTVRGTPLLLQSNDGEETFDKGLGTHPKTVLTYDLAGKYSRFEAVVGLDAATGKRGRADVRIRVDGKELPLPELKTLAAGNAIPVQVDVRGAKELTLVIDFGPAGDVQADVNWGSARLVE
ncbi:glycosyl hydrolase family 98 carbohydrate binding module : Uncharacterized protein OS=Planctomyces maris DSM 8797 GN=PM8797T_25396 PE=4 SV=1: NPCBM [Gemmata massiliana]|uniref:Glycosyl hydrolase family 98 putative carbohydrate-binding module domain-containing protein n=2 Tax=Gemmata massiliana TaxID=1210884 RepID=A0A6P2DAP4_9BACT|nr:glycosyl hydrolase family 98 carbohydrate binding module : Uncharacterized protein OS=Planctomyces maris DSM 8797 GN=PM8797T_25396 PE=4 SV=1: NPCBM [Gemmata massiliana]